MSTVRDQQKAKIEQDLKDLLAHAKVFGFVVSIEQVPLKPLAMGHHEAKVEIRDVNVNA